MDAEFNLSTRLGTDLSSRRLGAELRDEARRAIAAGRTVVFDFDGVRTVSDGFADELLAILVAEHGHDWFRQHVRLRNLSVGVRSSILEAVSKRLADAAAAH